MTARKKPVADEEPEPVVETAAPDDGSGLVTLATEAFHTFQVSALGTGLRDTVPGGTVYTREEADLVLTLALKAGVHVREITEES